MSPSSIYSPLGCNNDLQSQDMYSINERREHARSMNVSLCPHTNKVGMKMHYKLHIATVIM